MPADPPYKRANLVLPRNVSRAQQFARAIGAHGAMPLATDPARFRPLTLRAAGLSDSIAGRWGRAVDNLAGLRYRRLPAFGRLAGAGLSQRMRPDLDFALSRPAMPWASWLGTSPPEPRMLEADTFDYGSMGWDRFQTNEPTEQVEPGLPARMLPAPSPEPAPPADAVPTPLIDQRAPAVRRPRLIGASALSLSNRVADSYRPVLASRPVIQRAPLDEDAVPSPWLPHIQGAEQIIRAEAVQGQSWSSLALPLPVRRMMGIGATPGAPRESPIEDQAQPAPRTPALEPAPAPPLAAAPRAEVDVARPTGAVELPSPAQSAAPMARWFEPESAEQTGALPAQAIERTLSAPTAGRRPSSAGPVTTGSPLRPPMRLAAAQADVRSLQAPSVDFASPDLTLASYVERTQEPAPIVQVAQAPTARVTWQTLADSVVQRLGGAEPRQVPTTAQQNSSEQAWFAPPDALERTARSAELAPPAIASHPRAASAEPVGGVQTAMPAARGPESRSDFTVTEPIRAISESQQRADRERRIAATATPDLALSPKTRSEGVRPSPLSQRHPAPLAEAVSERTRPAVARLAQAGGLPQTLPRPRPFAQSGQTAQSEMRPVPEAIDLTPSALGEPGLTASPLSGPGWGRRAEQELPHAAAGHVPIPTPSIMSALAGARMADSSGSADTYSSYIPMGGDSAAERREPLDMPPPAGEGHFLDTTVERGPVWGMRPPFVPQALARMSVLRPAAGVLDADASWSRTPGAELPASARPRLMRAASEDGPAARMAPPAIRSAETASQRVRAMIQASVPRVGQDLRWEPMADEALPTAARQIPALLDAAGHAGSIQPQAADYVPGLPALPVPAAIAPTTPGLRPGMTAPAAESRTLLAGPRGLPFPRYQPPIGQPPVESGGGSDTPVAPMRIAASPVSERAPAMPLAPLQQQESGPASSNTVVYRAPEGETEGASPGGTPAEGGSKKAPENDVQLLATEVWSLLKFRLQAEAMRRGAW